MGRKKNDEGSILSDAIKKRNYAPARTDEGREKQLISLAMNLVEERMRNGTASSQEIVTILRMGSAREKLERENLEQELLLKKAKTEALESAKQVEVLYNNVIEAIKKYSGVSDNQEGTDE